MRLVALWNRLANPHPDRQEVRLHVSRKLGIAGGWCLSFGGFLQVCRPRLVALAYVEECRDGPLRGVGDGGAARIRALSSWARHRSGCDDVGRRRYRCSRSDESSQADGRPLIDVGLEGRCVSRRAVVSLASSSCSSNARARTWTTRCPYPSPGIV